jgi:23S rRNA (uracil1939-C5)-methyltransferase
VARLFSKGGDKKRREQQAQKQHKKKNQEVDDKAHSSRAGTGAVSAAGSHPKVLNITSLAQDGRGIARNKGKTVFVTGALPGEQVSVMHYRQRKRFDECIVRDVEQASAERVLPSCKHFNECGGCQLQHLEPAAQLFNKQEGVLEQLKRHAKLAPKVVESAVESSALGYRSRARLVVSKSGQLGFRQGGSNESVTISECGILDARLQRLLKPVQKWLHDLAVNTSRMAVTHIELMATDSEVALIVRHPKAVAIEHRQALEGVLTIEGAKVWWQAEKKGSLQGSAGRSCDPQLQYRLPQYDLNLLFKPTHFTQVNTHVNHEMVARAVSWMDLQADDRVADLFCGVGNFTLPMARKSAAVVGVEGVAGMVEQAKVNARFNNMKNLEFQAFDLFDQSVGQRLKRLKTNKMLLDPPRSGAREVCEQLNGGGITHLVYVSCNPMSLVRDSAILHDQGFKMEKFCVLDMFPHTAHVESMALFIRS